MRVLAIEASTPAGSVAVMEGRVPIGELWFMGPRAHSERLLVCLDGLLKMLKMEPRLMDGLAVGVGPGSFTGVRVALSTAKGLALGLEVPLVGISTLEALAGGVPFWPGLICPIVDARAGRVYGALFRFVDGRLEELEGEGIRELVPWITRVREPVLFLGDGAVSYKEEITTTMGDLAKFAPAEFTYPRASVVGRLGAKLLERGEHQDVDLLVPRYVRATQAERERVSRQDFGANVMQVAEKWASGDKTSQADSLGGGRY
ncbi:MAG: tRNA (adenosine(37)-N6)-threonylcarbamoyltransferase complex dimerization subunit type 1 TsaB [Thermodesulfobacteriota bacterium]